MLGSKKAGRRCENLFFSFAVIVKTAIRWCEIEICQSSPLTHPHESHNDLSSTPEVWVSKEASIPMGLHFSCFSDQLHQRTRKCGIFDDARQSSVRGFTSILMSIEILSSSDSVSLIYSQFSVECFLHLFVSDFVDSNVLLRRACKLKSLLKLRQTPPFSFTADSIRAIMSFSF